MDETVIIPAHPYTVAKALAAWTAAGPLTVPVHDAVGDLVEPQGGDWTKGEWPSNPVVDWHHTVPIGRGVVVMKSIPHPLGGTYTGPLGTTAFFKNESECKGLVLSGRDPQTGRRCTFSAARCVEEAGQAWPMVRDDYAAGLSMEFRPKAGHDEIIGKALIGGGWAKHYTSYDPVRYCHTPISINQLALVCPDSIGKALDFARTLVGSGRLPWGGRASDTILKAFAPTAALPRQTVARGGWEVRKGGSLYADPQGGMAGAAATEGDDQLGADSQPTPAIKTYKQAAQTLLDVADFLKHHVSQSEHVGLRGSVDDDAAKVLEIAQHLNGQADTAQDELDGKTRLDSMAEEAEAGADENAEAEDEALELDAPEEGDDADADTGDESAPPKKKKPPFAKGKSLNLRPMDLDDTGAIVTKAHPGWAPYRVRLSEVRDVGWEPTPEVETSSASPELKAAETDADRELRLAADEERAVRKEKKSAAPFTNLIRSR